MSRHGVVIKSSFVSIAALIVAAVFAASPTLAVSQPVQADTVLNQTGKIGAWSITDTSTDPGAIGKYHYYRSDNLGYLTRLWVNPPTMRAVAGKTNQTVGWLFMVERKICGLGGCQNWKSDYNSPEQTAVTDDAHDAAFSQATVGVSVVCGHNCYDLGAIYRVTVKMIWHRPDGSQQGVVKDRIYWYGAQATNGDTGVQEKFAGGAWSPDF